MSVWHLRDFHDDDLDQAVQLWDQGRQADLSLPVFPVSEVVGAARGGQPAVVAVVGEELVGMVVARAEGERGWIMIVALSGAWRNRGLGSALIAQVEQRLRAKGVRRIGAVLTPGSAGTTALENSGYRLLDGLVYYEKLEHLGAADAGLLAQLGGRVMPQGLWEQLAGMYEAKETIEKRIVLPLAEPEVAERYGVRPPKAVILFGPPGTGKTSFAKAVASRLGWPFVELFPSRLAADADGALAASLREVFADLAELGSVLLFIDEVEEIAAARSGTAVDPGHGVTNELLKLIPAFRDHDDRLLICATNSLRTLDPAFLRPGRFDYVIPVGPPDPSAREAIWRRYLGPAGQRVDLDRLVAASEMFTPADIEYAARKGSQRAFEHEIAHRRGAPPATDDYLAAIADTRPTLTERALADFAEDGAHMRL
ncbi:ATP-binding protein [Streptacidiphilus jiangxiensis]|uniref:Acetyltransferase (GNAT) family protein n=1 Tax=Streptacidiphilus jiangxiensis TaxID=235985 RepID=A0A1H7TTT2_STRJI|nr:GNAT family N-acetyltransferase [Streptacidiphilus jiangxiensis]SEL87317.1 Acetyltransferase (GNAT) family protein [Streptacidiphilus jiangxiensis]